MGKHEKLIKIHWTTRGGRLTIRKIEAGPHVTGRPAPVKGEAGVRLRAAQLVDNEERTGARKPLGFRSVTREEADGWLHHFAGKSYGGSPAERAGWLARAIVTAGTLLE